MMAEFKIHTGNVMNGLPIEGNSIQTCVTSPPYYGLRDYGVEGQFGLEETPELYVKRLVEIMREVRRVLRNDGTLWLNIGDSYANGGRKTRDPGQSKIHPAYEGEAYREGLRPSDPPGVKPKDLLGIPWMVAFALRSDGWYLRQDIIWHKPNPMPESVTDRPTKAHEYIFLLSKSAKYFYDHEAIKEPIKETSVARLGRGLSENHKLIAGAQGQPPHTLHQPRANVRFGGNKAEGYGTTRHSGNEWSEEAARNGANKRSVWTVATHNFDEAHFATFPPELIKPCILAGSKEGDSILDPFSGAGTTGLVALRHNRNYVGIELNPAYVEMSRRRLLNDNPLFNTEVAA